MVHSYSVTDGVLEMTDMLEVLKDVEENALPQLLFDSDTKWHSLFVDYEKPYVARLWCDWKGFRINLQKIFACEEDEALFHPHPWASAMRVHGPYKMLFGVGAGSKPPKKVLKIVLAPGSTYAMEDRNGWHSVQPLEPIVPTTMVTDKPWKRWSPASDKPLRPLRDLDRCRQMRFFQKLYGAQK